MPHVVVKLWPGKTSQQKQQLADAIASDVMSIMHCGEESVSVGFEEVPAKDWTEKVYRPEIKANWAQLYKKPGY
ncbi:4-oxalocrotonate tautomerase [Pseudoduganella eburnea]|uniref:4-oxalocrotonate tautomerase n=1 Tax=Massilia eburnea TaxID=1776165 RepID=A0A6L6QHN7_9BURK|nr:tautomerase family protein [Massilia eburnea]MTW11133.1 4-oxalocrotonate tautomerase [Massilia eburnea]